MGHLSALSCLAAVTCKLRVEVGMSHSGGSLDWTVDSPRGGQLPEELLNLQWTLHG